MRDISYKLFTHIVQFLLFCYILKNYNYSLYFLCFVKIWRKAGVNIFFSYRKCILQLNGSAFFVCVFGLVKLQIIFPCKHVQIKIKIFNLQHFCRNRIGMAYIPVFIKRYNTVCHIMQNSLKLILFPKGFTYCFIKF